MWCSPFLLFHAPSVTSFMWHVLHWPQWIIVSLPQERRSLALSLLHSLSDKNGLQPIYFNWFCYKHCTYAYLLWDIVLHFLSAISHYFLIAWMLLLSNSMGLILQVYDIQVPISMCYPKFYCGIFGIITNSSFKVSCIKLFWEVIVFYSCWSYLLPATEG